MKTPIELTLTIIEKSGHDVHHASESKIGASIECVKFESESVVKSIVAGFLSIGNNSETYSFDKAVNNKAVNATMIYFNAL